MAATMTRRHFVEIADTLRGLRPEYDGTQDTERARARWEETARAFADLCARTNPAFSRERFYGAAGAGEEE